MLRNWRDYAAATKVPAMKRSLAAVWVAVLFVSMLGLAGAAQAKPWWMRGIDSNETDFLPPNVAFRVAARVDGKVLKVRWVIADGYYLYRSKIEVKAESPDLVISTPELPPGTLKTDPYLGTQQIYTQQVEVVVPYSRIDAGAHPIQIKVIYQGCAEAGLCYPPITKVVFPTVGSPAVVPSEPPHPFESTAIIAGACAFLLAGLVLRKGRRLDTPA
jgi:thiol:disulfide interchange protein DsbD